MNEKSEVTQNNTSVEKDPSAETPATEQTQDGDEFQLTIRKLDMPVRPRGVLAD
jgi:hypothetical protein